ncbi:MAG TPA: hypothetical protein VH309_03075 [Elusimicrobiota bacterium]|jgi:hypothetical protein|nr:hypothetical protein [Elusimicrobiota bacterium]
MPEIKPVVNKEPERDKKKAGLLARLFGGGGSSGLGGVGGFGGAGGGGLGGLAGGGLLATKAGLIALIVAGTTLAGGIGMVGYRLFGPGAALTGNGDNLQLFDAKPKNAQGAGGQAAPADGNSASLQDFRDANRLPKPADASASAAPADAAAAGAAVSGSAASSVATGPLNKAGDTGNGVHKGMLKNVAKFGALTGPGGGGGSGAVASSAPQKASGALLAAKSGTLSGFKGGSAAKQSGGTSRSLAGKHFAGAAGQGFAVLGNQKGAQSSYAAGQTYDGAGSGGSNISGAGTPIGGPGAATAATAPAQPTSLPGPANSPNTSNIPTPTAATVCPWQDAIQSAQMIIGIAGLLLVAASLISKMKPYGPMISKVIGFAVAALGVMVIGLGAKIASGPYSQKLQGGVLAAAGAGLVLAGMMAGLADNTNAKGLSTNADGTPIADNTVTGTSAFNTSDGPSTGMLSGINPFVLIGGGAALIGLAAASMVPPTKYPGSDFPNGTPPDLHLWGYQELPSETALKKMVA